MASSMVNPEISINFCRCPSKVSSTLLSSSFSSSCFSAMASSFFSSAISRFSKFKIRRSIVSSLWTKRSSKRTSSVFFSLMSRSAPTLSRWTSSFVSKSASFFFDSASFSDFEIICAAVCCALSNSASYTFFLIKYPITNPIPTSKMEMIICDISPPPII